MSSISESEEDARHVDLTNLSTSSERKSPSLAIVPFNSHRIKLGICCMEVKATSKAMAKLLSYVNAYNDFKIVYFDLEKDVGDWPRCDCLIGFTSNGFPLNKAIKYAQKYPEMMVLNNLEMQNVLLSRLRVYRLLKELKIPCPPQVCVLREEEARLMGEKVSEFEEGKDFIVVDGVRMEKPFVEKPVDGENHNIYVYYHSKDGGGSRRLFRKVGDQASSFYPDVSTVRREGSYIYEKFVKCMKAQRDIKVYTIGTDYAHAESRVAPTTGEKVKRTGQGREKRYAIRLTATEHTFASQIVRATGQMICGIDMLRADDGKTYVFDINGWSSVKSKSDYHQRCGRFLRYTFLNFILQKQLKERSTETKIRSSAYSKQHQKNEEEEQSLLHEYSDMRLDLSFHQKKERETAEKDGSRGGEKILRGQICVFRHADRTPKQKIKIKTSLKLLCDMFDEVSNPQEFKEIKLKNDKHVAQLKELREALIEVFPSPSSCSLQSSSPPPSPPHSPIPSPGPSPVSSLSQSPTPCTPPSFISSSNHPPPSPRSPPFSSSSYLSTPPNTFSPSVEFSPLGSSDFKSLPPSSVRSSCPTSPLQRAEFLSNPQHRIETPKMFSDPEIQAILEGGKTGGEKKEKEKKDRRPGEDAERFRLVAHVIGMGFPGLKVQIKPTCAEPVVKGATKKPRYRITSVLFVCKWGGMITFTGECQSRILGNWFRAAMLPVSSDEEMRSWVSKLRVFSNNERRVRATADWFTAAFLNQGNQQEEAFVDDDDPYLEEEGEEGEEEGVEHVAKKTSAQERREVIREQIGDLVNDGAGACHLLGDCSGGKDLMSEVKETIMIRANSYNNDPVFNGKREAALLDLFPEGYHQPGGNIFREALFYVYKLVCAICDEIDELSQENLDIRFYAGENLRSIRRRWQFLRKCVFNREKGEFDTTKIPDVYDYISYDVLHNTDALKAFWPLYRVAKGVADFVIQKEYGLEPIHKLKIGQQLCLDLLCHVYDSLQRIIDGTVASQFYFTSESHIYSLVNLLCFSGLPHLKIPSHFRVNYLAHIVLKLYEDVNAPRDDPNRYSVEIFFSPGAHRSTFSALTTNDISPVFPMSPLTLSPLSLSDLESITLAKNTLSPPPSPLVSPKEGDSSLARP